MKRLRISGHPALMIISLFLAFFIWLAITNVSDPIDYQTISGIPVSFTNTSYVEANGQAFEAAEGYEMVSVRIYASRSVRERLSSQNITATADLTQIIDFNSDPVMVPVQVTVPGVSADDVIVSPRNIQIKLEDMKSKDFVVNAAADDSAPKNGYEVGTLTANPEQITIRGSESLINKIDRVTAQVNVNGLDADADLSAELKIYDKNGDELTETQKSYLTLSVAESEIKVHVQLYQVDTDVQISADTYGTPASGYQVGKITLTPSTLQVVGDEESLSALRSSGNEIIIDRASKAIDVSGASGDVTAKIDITEYLPEGINLASGISSTVVAEVEILPYGSKSFTLNMKNVAKNHLGDGLSAVFSEPELDIRVAGSDEALEALSADSIQASVDLSGLGAGTYTVPLDMTLPDGCSLLEDQKAEIVISKTQS